MICRSRSRASSESVDGGVTSTIKWEMRATIAVALASLALVAAGCGAASLAPGGSALGSNAAQLVPANALAFASVDTDQSSGQLQQFDRLTRGLPVRATLIAAINRPLAAHGLDYGRDVKPALGPEVDVAVLKIENGKPEAIALARPDDEAKLRALASRLDRGGEHYSVERIADWSVVADSRDAFAAVRAASKGRSLADTSDYAAATRALPAEAVARAYVSGRALGLLRARLPLLAASGTKPDRIAASLAADGDGLRIRIAKAPVEAANGSTLFGAVPSGAIFAVAFDGAPDTARQFRTMAGRPLRALGLTPAELGTLASGPGVVYVRAGSTIVPVFGAELRPANANAAAAALRALSVRLRQNSGGALTLVVRRDGGTVFVADAQAAIDDLRGSGPKLVDDPPFKDAVEAAGGGMPVLYADVRQLLPFLQLARGLVGTKVPKALTDNLGYAGTVVAVARRSGGVAQLDVRITKR